MVNLSIYKANFIYIISLTITLLLLSLLTGCNGGGSSSGSVSVVQKKVVDLHITLPSSSPMAVEDTSVYFYGEEAPVNSDGFTNVTVVSGEILDISLMLPAREGEELPTVYLSGTVVPGEIDVQLDAEETALALLLDGINQKYLQDTEIALFVKDLVRGESTDFIDYFTTAIEADPYLLRTDNIRNVLGQEYIDALTSINAILNVTFEVNSSLAVTSSAEASLVSFKASSVSEAGGSDSTRITIKPSWVQSNFKLGEITENGQYTGDLTLWNISMLPSLYKMTNTSTGEVMKALPKGILNTAFSSDIFAPYACPFNIVLPNYTSVESGSKNVQIEIYTPGLQNFDSTVYGEEGNVSSALLMRSAYSYAFIPVISAVIPLKNTSAAAFDILQKAGVFDELLPYWVAGDISGGIHKLYENYNGLPRAAIYSIIETAFGRAIENPDAVLAILGKKILTSQVSLVTAAIALEQLKTGLLNTPSKVTFYATFPIGITDVRPLAIKKIERDQTLPEFTLNGHGFKAFEFQDTWYKPKLSFQVFDNEDQPLSEDPVILENEDLRIDLTGTAITFSLPRYAVKTDTTLSVSVTKSA